MAYADLKNKLDEYNWDDGVEVPRTILADPDCDLALALEIFYLAGGYEYLEKSARRTKLQKWNPYSKPKGESGRKYHGLQRRCQAVWR